MTNTALTMDETILLKKESEFYEEQGYAASNGEMATYMKWSEAKVRKLRKSLQDKGYARQQKEGKKTTLTLLPVALGVIGAGVGAAAGVSMLAKKPEPQPAIIQPSFTQPTPSVVTTPEYIPIRETYVERGGVGYPSGVYPTDYYPQTQDNCAALGWTWKDNVCQPPDIGDSQFGIGTFCQQSLDAIRSGNITALNQVQYINQVCVIGGDYIEASALADAFCIGCGISGGICDRATLKCSYDKKLCSEFTQYTNCILRSDCEWCKDRCVNKGLCADVKPCQDIVISFNCTARSDCEWCLTDLKCHKKGECPKGTTIKDLAKKSELCRTTKGTFNTYTGDCICQLGYYWHDVTGCTKKEVGTVSADDKLCRDCSNIKNQPSCNMCENCHWVLGVCKSKTTDYYGQLFGW